MSQNTAEVSEALIPVVIIPIDGEASFILPASDWYGLALDKTKGDPLVNIVDLRILDAFCEEYAFDHDSIGEIDFSQTRTQAQLDALPEWGSF